MGTVEVVLNQPIRQLPIKTNGGVGGKVDKIDKFILYRSVEPLVHRIILRSSHSAKVTGESELIAGAGVSISQILIRCPFVCFQYTHP